MSHSAELSNANLKRNPTEESLDNEQVNPCK